MPKQDLRAGELEKAQEIADVIFPAGDPSARVVEPGEEAFNLPAARVPAQRPAVLSAAAPRAIRRNHLDAVSIVRITWVFPDITSLISRWGRSRA